MFTCSGILDKQKPDRRAKGTPAAALGQWYEIFTEGQKGDTIPGVPPQPPQLQILSAAVPTLTSHSRLPAPWPHQAKILPKTTARKARSVGKMSADFSFVLNEAWLRDGLVSAMIGTDETSYL